MLARWLQRQWFEQRRLSPALWLLLPLLLPLHALFCLISERRRRRTAGRRLPVLRVPARARYPGRELQALLQPYLGDAPERAAGERAGCPACGAELIERIARRGAHAGRPFLACSRFPACRHCEPLHRSQE